MFQSPSLRGSGRLESGAISGRQALHVSIPFIAGQWSLMASVGRRAARAASFNPLHCGAVVAWGGKGATYEQHCRSFNPLHCGAVVASSRRPSPSATSSRFNPLHCGAVVAWRLAPSFRGSWRNVSIPFIAGQWSLAPPRCRGMGGLQRFNPLHCGAVVASTEVSQSMPADDRRFNPLHCGAVVASPRTTPSSLFGVLLRKRRLPCDHIICTRLPF